MSSLDACIDTLRIYIGQLLLQLLLHRRIVMATGRA